MICCPPKESHRLDNFSKTFKTYKHNDIKFYKFIGYLDTSFTIVSSLRQISIYTFGVMSCGHGIMGRSNRHFFHGDLERGLVFFIHLKEFRPFISKHLWKKLFQIGLMSDCVCIYF